MEPIKKYKAVEKNDPPPNQHFKTWTIEPHVPYGSSWKKEVTSLPFEQLVELLNIAYTQGHIDTINGELDQN